MYWGKKVRINKIENRIIDDTESRSKARLLLKENGYQYVQAPDWICIYGDDWTAVEVKEKELYTPDENFPYFGIGLNKSQLFLRKKLQEGTGMRTYLMCFIKGANDIYGAFLDELEAKGVYRDTPVQNIRVYPLEFFEKWTTLDGSFEL